MKTYNTHEKFCPECGIKDAVVHAVPEHRRVWEDEDGAEVTEYAPAAEDCFCNNCSHEWTAYPTEGSPT